MQNLNDWDKMAEQALDSLNGIQRAAANPFLYTRIKARIAERQNVWVRAADFIARPLVAFSLTALFVGVNAWAIIEQQPVQKTASRHLQETEQSFDQDYATVNYSFGEINK